MFAKFTVLILAMGAFAAGLLSLRQSRLQVASEITQSQLRIEAADQRLWKLRTSIAERVTPGRVGELAEEVGPLRPLALPPLPVQDETSDEKGAPGTPAARLTKQGPSAGSP